MSQPIPRPERRAGFTIVEALVALTIFGIGTILLMQLAPRAVQYATRARVLSQANALAQAKVEELRALPQLHADLNAGAHQDPENPIDGTFTRTWDVTENDPIEGMRRVEVRVQIPTASSDSVATLVTYF
jgi:type II secretory pathway pseudopilin PulG